MSESAAVAGRVELNESAESLEAAARRFRRYWAPRRRNDAVIGFVMALVCGFILVMAIASATDNLSGRAFYWFMVAFGSLFELAAWLVVIFSIGKLVWKQPCAATTPEESARRCFGGALATPGIPVGYNPQESFLLLLDQAKVDSGGVAAFADYWKSVREEMIWIAVCINGEAGPGILKPGRHANVKMAIGQCTYLSPTVARVSLKFSANCTQNPVSKKSVARTVGQAEFEETPNLIKIGKRWYVASPFWRGRCTSALRPNKSSFRCQKCGYALDALPVKADATGWVTCPECGRDSLKPPGVSGRVPGSPAPKPPERPLNFGPPSPIFATINEIDIPQDPPANPSAH